MICCYKWSSGLVDRDVVVLGGLGVFVLDIYVDVYGLGIWIFEVGYNVFKVFKYVDGCVVYV